MKSSLCQQMAMIDYLTATLQKCWCSNSKAFLSDPGPIIVYPCQSLNDSLTNLLKLDVTTLLKIKWIDLDAYVGKYAEYAKYAENAENRENAENAENAEYVEYAEYAEYVEYAEYAEYWYAKI